MNSELKDHREEAESIGEKFDSLLNASSTRKYRYQFLTEQIFMFNKIAHRGVNCLG